MTTDRLPVPQDLLPPAPASAAELGILVDSAGSLVFLQLSCCLRVNTGPKIRDQGA